MDEELNLDKATLHHNLIKCKSEPHLNNYCNLDSPTTHPRQ